jgi:hypothetical protein
MNKYPLKQLTLGNINISPVLTGRELGYTESAEELTQILSKFNYEDILIQLARINLLLQRSKDFQDDERTLRVNFCNPVILNGIDASPSLRGRFIFSRQVTLRLLSECAQVSDPHSTYTLDRRDARNDLVKCYLTANGMLDDGSSGSDTISKEELSKQIIVDTVPTVDYAINMSLGYRTKLLMVRSAEFLHRLSETEEARLGIDANQIFSQAIGLTIQDYQHLVFNILAYYWSFSPLEIVRQDPFTDRSLFFDPHSVPDLAPLYEKFLPHTCISIGDLKEKGKKYSSFKNEFRLWRQYPLVEISRNHILCIDFYFLLEKLQNGVFWIIRDLLEQQCKGTGQKIIGLWGDIFEDYTASVITRGINAQVPRVERCVTSLKYNQKLKEECTDIAVCGKDTLILLECKSPLLRAETKFSGDFGKFDRELKHKIIEGERPEKARGVKQLCNAIQSLFHTDETQRKNIKEINISKISKIYPVLILSDRMFSVPMMNRYLDSEFERLIKCTDLKEDLDIKHLTVLTVEDIESLEPFLRHTPFHVHLDEWMQWQASGNDKLPFSAYLYSLLQENSPQNTFYDQKFDEMQVDIMTYFTERGVE